MAGWSRQHTSTIKVHAKYPLNVMFHKGATNLQLIIRYTPRDKVVEMLQCHYHHSSKLIFNVTSPQHTTPHHNTQFNLPSLPIPVDSVTPLRFYRGRNTQVGIRVASPKCNNSTNTQHSQVAYIRNINILSQTSESTQ